jgi:pyruvate kinase
MANDSFTTYFNRSRGDSQSLRARKRSKIVATIGPSCEHPEVLRSLVLAGMNVARLNMSHGTHADHLRRLEVVRQVSVEVGRPVAILADLQGPKIRTGKLKGGQPVELSSGSRLTITTAELAEGDAARVGTTYAGLSKDVKPGDSLLIDDGRLRLVVREVEGHEVHCDVLLGGKLSNNKGINLPGVSVSAPSLSDKDKEDLNWALANKVDYIALSFVRRAGDVQQLRRRIEDAGATIPIIAKIEREEAVTNMEEIIGEADGVMVARGDLGIEISTQRLPVVQKALISRANARGKLVITATQMLESMIENPFPTRAESSDVANAIFDGSDAVMLSGETAMGKWPLEAVSEMARIAKEAEESPYLARKVLDDESGQHDALSLSMTGGAEYLARHLNAAAVMIFSGNVQKHILMSKRRMTMPILSICHDESLWRRLSLQWGISPLITARSPDLHERIQAGLEAALADQIIKRGDTVVVLIGSEGGRARTLKVVEA